MEYYYVYDTDTGKGYCEECYVAETGMDADGNPKEVKTCCTK